MTEIYTKEGDGGTTIINGERIEKDNCKTKLLGAFDSLMSSMDRAIYGLDILPEMDTHKNFCEIVQDDLKDIASESVGYEQKISMFDIDLLEEMIDSIELDVYEFVRFSNPVSMDIDETRVRTRKLERSLTKVMREGVISDISYAFINRLSDYLFVLAVYTNEKFK